MRTVFASAPLRINDIGGWTDTWFSEKGSVLNMAVSPRVEVKMRVEDSREHRPDRVQIEALDFGSSFRLDPENPDYTLHPLLQAAVNALSVPKELELKISIHSPLPPGSSTGTSASVCVALLGALDTLQSQRHSLEEIAFLAHRVETEKLKLQSGIQDQICAALGGICFIQMPSFPQSNVTRLSLPEELWKELDSRIDLFYLGSSHDSSAVHEQVIQTMEEGGRGHDHLKILRELAAEAKSHLMEKNLVEFGRVMVANNECQRRLHPGLIPPQADAVSWIARKFGALGWKVNGAGGLGGSMTVLGCQKEKRRKEMRTEIEGLGDGIRCLPARLSSDGLRVTVSEAE